MREYVDGQRSIKSRRKRKRINITGFVSDEHEAPINAPNWTKAGYNGTLKKAVESSSGVHCTPRNEDELCRDNRTDIEVNNDKEGQEESEENQEERDENSRKSRSIEESEENREERDENSRRSRSIVSELYDSDSDSDNE